MTKDPVKSNHSIVDQSNSDAIIELQLQVQRLKDENLALKRKNKIATQRFRILKKYVGTLSTQYEAYGDGDEYERGECAANSRITNVLNHVISSIPDPKINNNQNKRQLFNQWEKPGDRARRREKRLRNNRRG